MSPRLTRAEQTERNRELVLAAARRVFLARGYHGATLETIADEAGFSKGVVYSQFRNKADLFLALLDARISERAEENARLAAGLAGIDGALAMVEYTARRERSESAWTRLVIEFRVHASRDPELSRRYAAAHERTLEGVAALIAEIHERAGEPPPLPARSLAVLLAALRSGSELEIAANPDAFDDPALTGVLRRMLASPLAASKETP
jgi:AcrR family transcriptional regulator